MAGPTTPDGLGGLVTPPELPGGAVTLVESTPLHRYNIWHDLGMTDVVPNAAILLYGPLNDFGLVILKGGITAAWWLYTLMDSTAIGQRLGEAMNSLSSSLYMWLLPTALAVGAVAMFVRRSKGEDFVDQLAIMLLGSVLAIGLGTSSPFVVQMIDDGRQGLSAAVSSAAADSLVSTEIPFAWPSAPPQGSAQLRVARTSGDALWRVLGVTPWCITEFGSLPACERYGAGWVKQTTPDQRKEYVDKIVKPAEGNDDEGGTVRYMRGHDPAGRISAALAGFIINLAAAVVVVALPLSALMTWLTALLLLAFGSLWACMLVVPGRIRQWGVGAWDMIGGLTLVSAITTGLLSVSMIVLAAVIAITSVAGWFPTAVLSGAALWATLRAKKLIEALLLSAGTGSSGLGKFAAFLTARSLMRGIGGLLGKSKLPRPAFGKGRGGRNSRGGGQSDSGPGGGPDGPDSGSDAPKTDGGPSRTSMASRVGWSAPTRSGRQDAPARRRRGRSKPTDEPSTPRQPEPAPDTVVLPAEQPASRPAVSVPASAPMVEQTPVGVDASRSKRTETRKERPATRKRGAPPSHDEAPARPITHAPTKTLTKQHQGGDVHVAGPPSSQPSRSYVAMDSPAAPQAPRTLYASRSQPPIRPQQDAGRTLYRSTPAPPLRTPAKTLDARPRRESVRVATAPGRSPREPSSSAGVASRRRRSSTSELEQ